MRIVDAGGREENGVTVLTPNADRAIASVQRRTAESLVASTPSDTRIRALVISLASKLRGSAAATEKFAEAMKSGKAPDPATQAAVRSSSIERRAAEKALREACGR